MTEDQDAAGTGDGLGTAVPYDKVTLGEKGHELQGRHEGGDGDLEVNAFETSLLRQGAPDEFQGGEGSDIVNVHVIPVLYIHIPGEAAVKIEGRGGSGGGEGGVVEGDHLHVPAFQCAIERG